MRLKLKNYDCSDFDLEDFPQDKLENFCILLTLSIGFDESNGADYFYVYIYSTEWLLSNIHRPMSLKNSIVTNRFNIEHILKLINDILEICNSTSEDKSISNLAKYFDWEFDDYNLDIQD